MPGNQNQQVQSSGPSRNGRRFQRLRTRFRLLGRSLRATGVATRRFACSRTRWLAGDLAEASWVGIFFSLVFGLICSAILLRVCNTALEPVVVDKTNPVPMGSASGGGEKEVSRITRAGKTISIRATDAPEVEIESLPFLGNDGKEMTDLRSRNYTALRQYSVESSEGESGPRKIMWIELGRIDTADRLSLILQVAIRRRKSDEDDGKSEDFTSDKPDYRVAWWKTNGLARSESILRIRRGFVFQELEFDTSPSALVSWIRGHWRSELREALPQYATLKESQINEAVAGPLDRILGEDTGHVSTSWPVLVVRVVNGAIQWITLGFFVTAILCLSARYVVWVRAENPDRIPLIPPSANPPSLRWIHDELKHVEEEILLHEGKWGTKSTTLTVWSESLNAVRELQSEVATQTRDFGDLEQRLLNAKGFFVRYLVAAIPAWGFIGTVWGIGSALGGTGSVLSNELAKQQSGVSSVALDLGLAFDTTLIALSLSLAVSFLQNLVSSREEGVLLQTRRKCLERLQGFEQLLSDRRAVPAAARQQATRGEVEPRREQRSTQRPQQAVEPPPEQRPAEPIRNDRPGVQRWEDDPERYKEAATSSSGLRLITLLAALLALGLYFLVVRLLGIS